MTPTQKQKVLHLADTVAKELSAAIEPHLEELTNKYLPLAKDQFKPLADQYEEGLITRHEFLQGLADQLWRDSLPE